MSYVRQTGRDFARKRKQRRSQLILIIVASAVVCGFIYAALFAFGIAPGSQFANNGPTCTTTVTKPPQSRVVLNVYNASHNQGQAQSAARSFGSRNFNVAMIGNDPYQEKLSGVGQIRVGRDGVEFAKTYVLPLVPGAQLVVDGRTGTSVDVVLGDQFKVPPMAAASQEPAGDCKTVQI